MLTESKGAVSSGKFDMDKRFMGIDLLRDILC